MLALDINVLYYNKFEFNINVVHFVMIFEIFNVNYCNLIIT